MYALAVAGFDPGGWLVFPAVVLAAPTTAGLLAAWWWTPATGSPDDLRVARVVPRVTAGTLASATGVLLITILTRQLLLLLGGPLLGALLGSLGPTIGVARPRKPRPGRSRSGGPSVISS